MMSAYVTNTSNITTLELEPGNGSRWNESFFWGADGADLDGFFRPDFVIISMYIVVLVVSLCANSLLIFIVLKFQYMRSVTNIFLVNLSVADLLVTLFCMPIQISKSITVVWYYGSVMCKTVNYFQGVAVSTSVFTITAMAVDRYLAITQSLRQPWIPSRRRALLLIGGLWLASLAIFSPLLSVAEVQKEFIPVVTRTAETELWHETTLSFCTEKWPDSMQRQLFGILSFILVYAIPGCVVVMSYSLMGRRLCSVLTPFDLTEGSVNSQQRLRLVRERKRVAWILLLLAVLFAICWLPYNVLQLFIDINADIPIDYIVAVMPYTLLLGHANSAINPIVYCLMTRNFRRSLRKLLCREPANNPTSAQINLRSLRQKSNTTSLRTRTTGPLRRSNNAAAAASAAAAAKHPNVQYGRVRSFRENGARDWKEPQYL